jgi:hypothetical protein
MGGLWPRRSAGGGRATAARQIRGRRRECKAADAWVKHGHVAATGKKWRGAAGWGKAMASVEKLRAAATARSRGVANEPGQGSSPLASAMRGRWPQPKERAAARKRADSEPSAAGGASGWGKAMATGERSSTLAARSRSAGWSGRRWGACAPLAPMRGRPAHRCAGRIRGGGAAAGSGQS